MDTGERKVKTRVIVVGAGPVGLTLAGELRLGGVDVVVYDKLPAPSGESRALGFTKRVAELFDQRGLLTRLGDFNWGQQSHFGGLRIDLDALDEEHHGVRGLPQSRTEEMLANWLSELGVPVRRGYEAVGFRETQDGVTVVFEGPQGRHEESAGYLVGCDGGGSTIRTAAGIEAPGWEATRGMYMADITGAEVNQRPIGERVPGGNMVLSISLGDGYYRILIHDKSLRPRPDSEALTFAEVADAWQRMTGESLHHAQPRWMAAFSNAAGLAAEYRRGRVFLAGDAAHNTPPLAGWGLAVGIQDAVNLGWKLAAVIGGSAPEGLLDSYHTERYPLGQQLMRNTHAGSMLYLSGEEMEPLREVMRELVDYKAAAGHLAGMVSGLSVRYDMGSGEHPLLGMRMPPECEVELPDGGRTRVAELLHQARGVFISTGGDGEAERLAAGWSDRVDVVTGSWAPAAEGRPARTLPDAVLVRPDGYIAWAAPGGGDLCEALGRWFGSARAAVDSPAAALS
ncbi:FAD-dependent monooxygenase [Streptomyces sp. N2-109]|uniref:FAD-dependent monooxygenase n=1 Tax=Streptomyces gossypii TaxID=2883101 RepID=A0ABT2JKL4_9ACTN|nr:FAD-dependent monooxygenase [Streptomyces gossypii]MCT2588413.1 FAD-dependent monooxygenase [Streptomyces gossypii]